MKTVLFATSALALSAGFAAAEVSVTGDARIGLMYDSAATCIAGVDGCGTDATRGAWNVVNRARVHFTMTGESESGLSFGAKLRADQANAARVGGSGLSGTRGEVWVSGSYGKLTAGDIDSAAEVAVGDLPEVGLTGLRYWNETVYQTSDMEDQNDNATLRYDYAINGVNLSASFSDGYQGNTGVRAANKGWALGASYDMSGYQVGLGYERSDSFMNPFAGTINTPSDATFETAGINKTTTWALSGGTTFNDVKIKAVYAQTSVDFDTARSDAKLTQLGLGAEYAMANGVGLSGFYKQLKLKDYYSYTAKGDAIGLGASYDLGGGATVKGGLVSYKMDRNNDASRETVADFGLAFKF